MGVGAVDGGAVGFGGFGGCGAVLRNEANLGCGGIGGIVCGKEALARAFEPLVQVRVRAQDFEWSEVLRSEVIFRGRFDWLRGLGGTDVFVRSRGCISFGEVVLAHLFEGGKRTGRRTGRRNGEAGLKRDAIGDSVIADLFFTGKLVLQFGIPARLDLGIGFRRGERIIFCQAAFFQLQLFRFALGFAALSAGLTRGHIVAS